MNLKNNIAVIIPAAGSSSRFDGKLPKQFLNIGHESVLEKTVNLFLGITSVKKIFIAINPAEKIIQSQSFYDHSRINIVEGGNSRSQSVLNALNEIDDDISIVAIHDAARPWLRKDHFNDLLSEFINDQNIHRVYPVIPISDSLRMNSKSGPIPVQREDFLGVQTPQIFYIDDLKKAFKQSNKKDLNFSDESQLMEYAGFKISSNGERWRFLFLELSPLLARTPRPVLGEKVSPQVQGVSRLGPKGQDCISSSILMLDVAQTAT